MNTNKIIKLVHQYVTTDTPLLPRNDLSNMNGFLNIAQSNSNHILSKIMMLEIINSKWTLDQYGYVRAIPGSLKQIQAGINDIVKEDIIVTLLLADGDIVEPVEVLVPLNAEPFDSVWKERFNRDTMAYISRLYRHLHEENDEVNAYLLDKGVIVDDLIQ